MFRWLNSKRGQNTAEYAILIGVIVAAAIAMQIYIRRGMQARIKDAVDFTRTADDDAGNAFFGNLGQYEPYYYQTNFETSQSGQVSEQIQEGGGVIRDSISDTTQRTGNQIYGNYMEGNV
ncbi:MAG: hypothetical protein PHH75_00700 [Candidatus Omnitrophica bacterium]|nr:hypothetical protein [Candidatus Omnitrophota bacterium]MDD5573683.1 hypothetical protein [Candidatus Omnitrophota bacterium]